MFLSLKKLDFSLKKLDFSFKFSFLSKFLVIVVCEKLLPGPKCVCEKWLPGPKQVCEKRLLGPKLICENMLPGPKPVSGNWSLFQTYWKGKFNKSIQSRI